MKIYIVTRNLLISSLIFAVGNIFSETFNLAQEKKKIDQLLEIVKKSDTNFYRNGEKHTSKKAAAHLKFKYNRAKNKFVFFGPETKYSAREFIDKIATKSSTTGKPYFVELSGQQVKVGDWLHQKLKDIETKK